MAAYDFTEFGELLKKIREANGKTYLQMAREVDAIQKTKPRLRRYRMNPTKLESIESGKIYPHIVLVNYVINNYEVSEEDKEQLLILSMLK